MGQGEIQKLLAQHGSALKIPQNCLKPGERLQVALYEHGPRATWPAELEAQFQPLEAAEHHQTQLEFDRTKLPQQPERQYPQRKRNTAKIIDGDAGRNGLLGDHLNGPPLSGEALKARYEEWRKS